MRVPFNVQCTIRRNVPQVPVIGGLYNWNTSTRLGTAGGQGLLGATTGHWMRCLLSPLSISGTNTTRVLSANSTAGGGWSLISTGTNTSLFYRILVTGLVTVASPTLTITSAMVGKWLDCLYIWDTTQLLAFINGVSIGNTTSGLTYLVPSGDRTMIGTTSVPSSPASDCLIAAVEGGDGFIPTATEVLRAHERTRAATSAGRLPYGGIPGKTTWRAQCPPGWNAPSRWRDEIASVDATIVTGSAANLLLQSRLAVFA